ncbi:MAG: FAD-dependent oxidoreductase, partial [Chloroflexi bacterium]|nr:FAD-dependent oxidoreductase [Chloroflexota bacterium]
RDFGVQVLMEGRVVDAVVDGNRIKSVLLDGRKEVKGDAFVDCTGTSGGLSVCKKYGHGCVMCGSYRCLVFGDRVSMAGRAGVKESDQCRPDGKPGLISAAVSLHKASLERGLRSRLENEGAVLVPMPENLIDYSKFEKIGSVGLREHQEYVNLVNIGPVVKCVKLGYLSVSELRTVPGLENAQIEDPLGGGKFGFIKLVAVTPRDNTLKVPGLSNLFVGGEKCGQVGGIAECLVTGILAGNNAARAAAGAELLELPRTIAIGDYIASTGEQAGMAQPAGQGLRMGQGPYFQTMKQKGFYNPDPAHAHKRVQEAGLAAILARKV